MSTVLKDVGLQVWRGSLLMADYILHNGIQFQGCTVLELGAGVGLVSIVAALHASNILCTGLRHLVEVCPPWFMMHSCSEYWLYFVLSYFVYYLNTIILCFGSKTRVLFLSCCTDVGNRVLDLCQRNIERNLLELDTTGNILVRELNWTKPCCTSSKQSSTR